MAKDGCFNSSQLFIYLNKNGCTYDPSVETFREFIKRLGIKSVIHSKYPHFFKSDVDSAIKKFKEK